MPVGVQLLTDVRAFIGSGDLAHAQELLNDALADLPTDPAEASSADAEAVALQTGVLLGLGEPYAARGWAAYAHLAYRNLHGDRDRRTLHALGLLAAVLTRVGAHVRATQRYQHLITVYTELDGERSDRTLAARADLATVEHARGHCATARMRLATVIDEHQQVNGPVHPVGIRMLARLAAMWRDCGDFDTAHSLLAEARAHAAELPDDEGLHRLLQTATRAPADQRHICGTGLIPETPLSPAPMLAIGSGADADDDFDQLADLRPRANGWRPSASPVAWSGGSSALPGLTPSGAAPGGNGTSPWAPAAGTPANGGQRPSHVDPHDQPGWNRPSPVPTGTPLPPGPGHTLPALPSGPIPTYSVRPAPPATTAPTHGTPVGLPPHATPTHTRPAQPELPSYAALPLDDPSPMDPSPEPPPALGENALMRPYVTQPPPSPPAPPAEPRRSMFEPAPQAQLAQAAFQAAPPVQREPEARPPSQAERYAEPAPRAIEPFAEPGRRPPEPPPHAEQRTPPPHAEPPYGDRPGASPYAEPTGGDRPEAPTYAEQRVIPPHTEQSAAERFAEQRYAEQRYSDQRYAGQRGMPPYAEQPALPAGRPSDDRWDGPEQRRDRDLRDSQDRPQGTPGVPALYEGPRVPDRRERAEPGWNAGSGGMPGWAHATWAGPGQTRPGQTRPGQARPDQPPLRGWAGAGDLRGHEPRHAREEAEQAARVPRQRSGGDGRDAVVEIPGPLNRALDDAFDADELGQGGGAVLIPIAAPLFTSMAYLPPHPELHQWEPPHYLPELVPPPVRRQMSSATVALIAACVGIIAVTVLFLLLLSAARD